MKNNNDVLRLKSKVRGIIANNNSSKFRKASKFESSVGIEMDLFDILEEARSKLDSNTYQDFIIWSKNSVGYQIRKYQKPFGALKKQEISVDINKNSTMNLAIKIIDSDRDKILKFIDYKEMFFDKLINGENEGLFAFLDKIDLECGKSLWSISFRLFLYQFYFSLEKQKEYLEIIKKEYPSGLMPFILHRLSIKNEPQTNIDRYKISIKKYFKENKNNISQDLYGYLIYKLVDSEVEDVGSLARILYFEMKFNSIDLFDTLSSVLRRNKNKNGESYRSFIKTDKINLINDLIIKSSDINRNEFLLSDTFNEKNYVIVDKKIQITYEIRKLFSNLLLFNHEYEDSLNKLKLLLEMLSRNDSFYYLHKLVLFFESYDEKNVRAFNSYENIDSCFPNYLHDNKNVVSLYEKMFNLKTDDFKVEYIKDEKFYNLYNVIKIKNNIEHNISLYNIRELANYLLSNNFEDRFISFIIDDPFVLIDNLHLFNKDLLPLLIVLNKYNTVLFSEDLQSEISYIIDKELELNDKVYPSELMEVEVIDSHYLTYFFREICRQNILDNCESLDSSKAVNLERRKVLSHLIKLDEKNSDVYHEEILSITSDLKIKSAIEHIDATRIHVDEDSLKNVIIDEYYESLRRYESLVKAGIGVSKNFEDIVDLTLKNIKSEDHIFDTPNNEADVLLIETINGIASQFLFNPKFGLDGFLSKRIRHNSIVGFVRAAPEEYGLVTNQPSKSEDYIENEFWMSKIPDELQEEVNLSLKHFTASFDDYLKRIKDNYIQIKTYQNPDGLIVFELPNTHFVILKSLFQDQYDISTFISSCFSLFWISLEPSLESIRNKFKNEYCIGISKIHDNLSSNLERILHGKKNKYYFNDINRCVIDSRTQSLVYLNRASSWFTRISLVQKQYFTVKEWLEVSLEAAQARHLSAKMTNIIHVKNDSNILIAHLLNLQLADIIQIIVGNISDHLNMYPTVLSINVDLDINRETIFYEFKNPIPCSPTSENEKLLEEIRIKINNNDYQDKLTKEGNSGLYKIASIIHDKDDKGSISFYYEHKTFVLKLSQTYSKNMSI